MSNNLPKQERDSQPTGPAPSAYPPSLSQVPLASAYGTGGLQNPYAGYAYTHDTSSYAYIPPSPYRSQLQTLQQQQPPPPAPAAPQISPVSPIRSRKRRASELEGAGASSSNNSFTRRPGLVTAGSGPEASVGPSDSQLSSPVAKKGRTNTPWTPAEEHLLKQLKDSPITWQEIAKSFPNRTEGSVKKHWYKDMHHADFGENEVSADEHALLAAIREYDRNKWKVIGEKVGKPAKACEQLAKDNGWLLG